jgi:flagellar biosynthetic protein FliO
VTRGQIFPYVIAVLLAGALALGVGAAWAAMAGEEKSFQAAAPGGVAESFEQSLESSAMLPRGELPTRAEAPGTASLLRLGVGLAIVLTLLFGLLLLLRRMGYGQQGSVSAIEIVASRNLGPRERVVLLRHGERHLLLGVAPGRVATLDQWVHTFQEFDQ